LPFVVGVHLNVNMRKIKYVELFLQVAWIVKPSC